MPEQISKYPDVTLSVLKGAGAACGEGAEQKILKKCPTERFCALPTGEICVYGIDEIPQMTQITLPELARVVCPSAQQGSVMPAARSGADVVLWGLLFGMGLVIGMFWRKSRIKEG
jgi:hypothetical protein